MTPALPDGSDFPGLLEHRTGLVTAPQPSGANTWDRAPRETITFKLRLMGFASAFAL
jgi:hypothetical protein